MKKLILAFGFIVVVGLQAKAVASYVETVIGYKADGSGIVFQVYNGGCTQKDEFFVEVKRDNSHESNVTLYRKKLDRCKAFFPYGLKIEFSYESLGIRRNEVFKISNPINPGFMPELDLQN